MAQGQGLNILFKILQEFEQNKNRKQFDQNWTGLQSKALGQQLQDTGISEDASYVPGIFGQDSSGSGGGRLGGLMKILKLFL